MYEAFEFKSDAAEAERLGAWDNLDDTAVMVYGWIQEGFKTSAPYWTSVCTWQGEPINNSEDVLVSFYRAESSTHRIIMVRRPLVAELADEA